MLLVDLVQLIKKNNMKVLDLDKIAKLEATYRKAESQVALDALHNMVSIISQMASADIFKDSVALSTLEAMDLLVDTTKLKQSKQLNS